MNPLIPWRGGYVDPWDEFHRLIKWPDMENEFKELKSTDLIPALDVYEDKDKLIIESPIAGVDPEKVEVSIENDVLTIKGESEKKTEVDEKNYYRKEAKYGSFYRAMKLPVHVMGDKATASYADGLLKIEVPKAALKVSPKIKVQIKKQNKKK